MSYNLKHIKKFENNAMNESEHDASQFVDCLESLKKVSYGLPMRIVIEWFNKSDIDYYNMSDLEMIIKYIEENLPRQLDYSES
jgi:hypothetical protein